MEKQNLDNLQRTTKEYSVSGRWVGVIMGGSVFMVLGLMMFFGIGRWDILILLFFVLTICVSLGSKYLNRAVMRKGLGYVKQKKEADSQKQKFSWKQFLVILLIPFIFIVISWAKNLNGHLPFVALLGVGIITMIVGLINWEKTDSNIIFYGGVYFVVCAIMGMSPIRHILHAHEMSSMGIMMMTFGFGLILSGIIRYFQYKKIVQKVKETN
ncbi:MAG: hypothetical protein WC614_09195 [bacterium]